MTNLTRLKLELNNRDYFQDEIYLELLEENNLDPFDDYDKANDRVNLLETVYSVLQMLSNDTDKYIKVETEFATTSAAYQHLQKRLKDVRSEIDRVKTETHYEEENGNTNGIISYMFYNRVDN